MSSATQFGYFQYTSLLGTHTLLLFFTALFLPRSTLLITTLPPQQSSIDKPQHPLLEPLTASPVWTLLWMCAGVGVCQAWWGGWMRVLWGSYPRQGGGDVYVSGGGKIEALRNAWINTLIVSALFHVVIVLFGAPISSYTARTYLLSLLLSILTIFVPSYTLSLPITLNPFARELGIHWIRLFIQRKVRTAVERALVLPVLGSVLGCWAGAFPIPLDWDRPWQAWPLTPAYGALTGYILGSWSSLFINAALFLADAGRDQDRDDDSSISGSQKTDKSLGMRNDFSRDGDASRFQHTGTVTVPESGGAKAKKRNKKKRE